MKAGHTDWAAAGTRWRLRCIGRRYAGLAGLGFIYLIWVLNTGWGLPCPIRYITGLQCPGCGVTHLCVALWQGDLAAAWAANPALLLAAPLLLGLVSFRDYRWVRTSRYPDIPRPVTWGLIAYFLLFMIGRNIGWL